jgi:thymidylate synthase (FAD)
MKDLMGLVEEKRIDVLDHGFIRLVDSMPRLVDSDIPCADVSIVQAARISYGQGSKGEEADKKLIDYLYRNKHSSPFEMVEFKFHTKMPIFVARQWVRHRTANINEISARYTELTNDYYVPDQWRAQSLINKQGSDDLIWFQGPCRNRYKKAMELCLETYHALLEQNVAREMARMVLPVSIYTEWYWKCDLHNILNFLRLRLHEHAQYEIRVYAEAMLKLIQPIVPWTIEAFKKYSV